MNQMLESNTKDRLQNETIYCQILEYSVETIFLHVDQKILYINQAGADFLKGSKKDIIGANPLCIIPDFYKPKITERIQKAMMAAGPIEVIEQSIARLDGTFVDVEFYCQPVQFGGRKAIQTGLRDITKRKNSERQLNEREKLASIGQMAVGIAHEVKNPLTSVKGFLQLIKETNTHPYLLAMESELEKAIDTLQNLLQVSKPNLYSEPITKIDLCKELSSLIFLFQDKLYNTEIEMDLRNSDKMIIGKKNLFLKAFFNLIKNALEAVPEKGKIRIEHYFRDDCIYVKISDNGIGIPKDKIDFLGTPFYSSKGEGTGLGLTQVFTTVKEYGGTVQVESELGIGTTFLVKLPLHPTSC
ncbi:MAG: ATP-binding protein [Paenisporosarcina sp.]|uniref:two-component system sensor histidine kinase NtrB n=1 Tax=Paenisporosarcina sp. TaxID=1932001 RepID=UPI003C7521FC